MRLTLASNAGLTRCILELSLPFLLGFWSTYLGARAGRISWRNGDLEDPAFWATEHNRKHLLVNWSAQPSVQLEARAC